MFSNSETRHQLLLAARRLTIMNLSHARAGRPRGYEAAWERLRERHRTEHPLCARCWSRGIVRPMRDVDHVIPFTSGDDPRRLDPGNLHARGESSATNSRCKDVASPTRGLMSRRNDRRSYQRAVTRTAAPPICGSTPTRTEPTSPTTSLASLARVGA